MGTGYSRQSSYQDDDVIFAADTNDEFNGLLAAFNQSTGHNHDGTEGNGSPITFLRRGNVEARITENGDFEVAVGNTVIFTVDADGIGGTLIDTAVDLGGDSASDVRVASQRATKLYADTKVAQSQLTGDVELPDGTRVPLVSAILGYINTEADTRKLTASRNLSDIPDAEAARTNLDAIQVGQVTYGDITDVVTNININEQPDANQLASAVAIYDFVSDVARTIQEGSVVWKRVSTSSTLENGGLYGLDVRGGPLTLTLPAPSDGFSTVAFFVADGSLETNPVTLVPNSGNTIMEGVGSDSSRLVVDVDNISFELIYNGSTWRLA